MTSSEKTKAVLITGAGSGIGLTTAGYLADRGYLVFAGLRKFEESSLPDGLKKPGIVPLQLDVMAVGCLAVTQACLPQLRQDGGRIINMGSVSGRTVARSTGAYSAAKFALSALSSTLRMELKPWQMPVSLIELGSVQTPLWDKVLDECEGLPGRVSPKKLALYYPDWSHSFGELQADARKHLKVAVSAEKVASVIEKVLSAKNPKARYLVGREAWLNHLALRFLPEAILEKVLWGIFRDQDQAGH